MGLLNFIKNQFIDIIEFPGEGAGVLSAKYPDQDREIKNGAKLIVNPGQVAVFVREGKLADIFQPGMYTLTTNNLPILSDIMGWKYGFESPFKCDVFYVSTVNQLDMKWGTSNPVMMRDKEFGPVRVKAFGIYAFQVADTSRFISGVAGTAYSRYTVDDIEGQLKRTLVSRFSSELAKANLPVLDMAANYQVVAEAVRGALQEEFSTMGLNLTKFFVENISLPQAVTELLDQRSGAGMMADAMPTYMQMQTAQAMRAAAENPSGGAGAAAGAGMGLGAGFAMANMYGNQMGMVPPATAAPAAAAVASQPVAGARCVSCGHGLAAGAKFCGECGTKQGGSNCPSCQVPLPAGAKFCSSCGHRMA